MSHEENINYPKWVLYILLGTALFTFLVMGAVSYSSFVDGTLDTEEFYPALIIVVVTYIILYILFFRFPLSVKYNHEGIHYYCFPFTKKRKTILWKNIEQVKFEDVNPIGDFGGWGYRSNMSGNKRGYIMKAGSTLAIKQHNAKFWLYLSTREASAIKRVVEKHLPKEEHS